MVGKSTSLKRCFPKSSLVAYRRSKSLGDLLVRAKVNHRKSSRTNKQNGFNLCTRRSCTCCILGERATTHTCQSTGQTWEITAPISCDTEDVVYNLRCRKCPEWVYIGETGGRFCDRFTQHRGYVTRKELDKPAGAHFNLKGHDVTDMIPLPFERILPRGDTLLRKRREKLWINRYDSVDFGANSRD